MVVLNFTKVRQQEYFMETFTQTVCENFVTSRTVCYVVFRVMNDMLGASGYMTIVQIAENFRLTKNFKYGP